MRPCTPMWRRKRPLCQIALPKLPSDAIARSLGWLRQSALLKWRYGLGFDMRRRSGAAFCLIRLLFQTVYLIMPTGFWVLPAEQMQQMGFTFIGRNSMARGLNQNFGAIKPLKAIDSRKCHVVSSCLGITRLW